LWLRSAGLRLCGSGLRKLLCAEVLCAEVPQSSSLLQTGLLRADLRLRFVQRLQRVRFVLPPPAASRPVLRSA
jgi:hypothetical protein